MQCLRRVNDGHAVRVGPLVCRPLQRLARGVERPSASLDQRDHVAGQQRLAEAHRGGGREPFAEQRRAARRGEIDDAARGVERPGADLRAHRRGQ